jgi:hypothetical protein
MRLFYVEKEGQKVNYDAFNGKAIQLIILIFYLEKSEKICIGMGAAFTAIHNENLT